MNAVVVCTNGRVGAVAFFAAALVVLSVTSAAQAQLTDLQNIIQDLLQAGGQPTTPTTTQPATGDGQTTTQVPTSGKRQTIITNQFTSTSLGAIQARRPGLWLRQAIAVDQGDTSFFTGVPEEEPSFLADTLGQVITQITTVIQGILEGINTLVVNTLRPGGTGGQGTTFTPATTGQGTRNPIQ